MLYQPQIKEKEERFRHFIFSFSVSSGPEENPGQPEGKAEPRCLGLFVSITGTLNGTSVHLVGPRKFFAFQSSSPLKFIITLVYHPGPLLSSIEKASNQIIWSLTFSWFKKIFF